MCCGQPFVTLIHDNGHIECVCQNPSGKHNVIHPVMMKYINDEIWNVESIFYAHTLFELFFDYKRERILYRAHPNYQNM